MYVTVLLRKTCTDFTGMLSPERLLTTLSHCSIVNLIDYTLEKKHLLLRTWMRRSSVSKRISMRCYAFAYLYNT